MKRTIRTLIGGLAFASALILILQPSSAHAQGTAFTYQGRLDVGGVPYSGLAEMQFSLWTAASGGSQVGSTLTVSPVAVSNGLFSVTLDFGPGVFDGADRWLEIAVRTNLLGFSTLSPRQQLTASPYAVAAGNLTGTLPASQLSGLVPSANLGGVYSGAVTFNNPANSFSGSGAGLTGLNASQLASGTVPDGRLGANLARTNQVWLLGGNGGTTPGTHFLGTTDNQPLEIKVNGQRALQLQPHPTSPNLIGGYSGNYVAPGVYGGTIGGGGEAGFTNAVFARYGTIAGGRNNTIQPDASSATIGGGRDNTIQTNAFSSTIGGGYFNTIQPYAFYATISGGAFNTIQPNAPYATIGGGFNHIIEPTAESATIGGGIFNMIQTNAWSATIGGGSNNTIQAEAWCATIGGGQQNTIQTNAWSATIGGGVGNTIQPDASSSTIGGGQENMIQRAAYYATIGGGYFNMIQTNARSATIGGGSWNMIQPYVDVATIGGGQQNMIQLNAHHTTIGGGQLNTIEAEALYATIGGGQQNTIQTNARSATIGGGQQNTIQTNAWYATVGGGANNTIQPGADYATIPGGRWNSATNYAFAAGNRAKANHTGSFVWADSTGADFVSTRANQFNLRATGGVRVDTGSGPGISLNAADTPLITRGWDAFGSSAPAAKQGHGRWGLFMEPFRLAIGIPDDVPGRYFEVAKYSTNGTSTQLMRVEQNGTVTASAFNTSSDRNAKENLTSVDGREVLEKVAALPIFRWNFKGEAVTHLGPTAQDFRAAFGLGSDDRHIATVDADGVALAAIQGLNQKLEETRAENAALKARLEKLERLLAQQLNRN